MRNAITIKKYSAACPNELCRLIGERIGNCADVTINGTHIYVNGFIPKYVDVRCEVDKVITEIFDTRLKYEISLLPSDSCQDEVLEYAYATNETTTLVSIPEEVADCFLKNIKIMKLLL